MSKRVHWKKRSVTGLVTIIVFKLTLGELRACCRLSCNEPCLFFSSETMSEEREGNTSEVGSTSETSDYDIRIVSGLFHLLLGLKTDDGLMKGHMIHYRAKGIFTTRGHSGKLHSLGYRCSKRALMVRIPCEDILSCPCGH